MSTLGSPIASEQANTEVAIEAATAEASNQDDPGHAAVLRQLHKESLHYHVRADLDAVITRNATERQDKDFLCYVEATTKRVEAKGRGERQSSFEGREAEDN